MPKPFQFYIRAVADQDRDWIQEFIKSSWGDESIVVHQELYYPHALPGFLACREQTQPVGLITYQITGDICEIITLDSLIANRGVGTSLLEAVAKEGRRRGCVRLRLTTTNDNQQAIDFYSNRGFNLKEIHPGAVDQAREIKPSIPRFTPEGIAIQDEWEFELRLVGKKGDG